MEAARHLAQRAMLAAGGDVDRQFDFVASHLLARTFDENERAIAKRAYQDYLTYYDPHPEDAKKLLTVGESKAEETLLAPGFAALTMVANQILNLDEVLNK